MADATLLFTTDEELSLIAGAIQNKTGITGPLTYPDDFIDAITSIGADDVIFYDDLMNNGEGGIYRSYSAYEFLALTAMPANPDHSDFTVHEISIPMTSQGWNWSLADAKTYVEKHGKLTVGQMYIPTDGKTHFVCYVRPDAPSDRRQLYLDLYVESGDAINYQIDNGAQETWTSNNKYATFTSTGWHDIKINTDNDIEYSLAAKSNETNDAKRGQFQVIKNIFIGENVPEIKEGAFRDYYSLFLATLPYGITSVGENAFHGCTSLKRSTLPADASILSDFNGCPNLKSVTFPNGVTSLPDALLANCYYVTNFTIPDTVTEIGDSAFYNTSVEDITIPDSVTTIGTMVFQGCHRLKHVYISENITSIPTQTFMNCYVITNINIPYGVTTIENSAFSNCSSLINVNIPDTVTTIGNNVFSSCNSLININMPDTATSIGYNVFGGCRSLLSITLPNGITSLEGSLLYGNYSIYEITIPSSVTSIKYEVFKFCYSLKSITILAETPPTITNINAFDFIPDDCQIIVPAGTLSAYQAAEKWSTLSSHIVEATA